jgi:hypothetical protein
MNREPKNIEELWHSATLAEKTISSTVSSIDHKLSQILVLHQHIYPEEHAQNTAGWVNESPQKMGIIDG